MTKPTPKDIANIRAHRARTRERLLCSSDLVRHVGAPEVRTFCDHIDDIYKILDEIPESEPAKPVSLHPDGCAARWSVKPIFAWYDLWVGIFWDSRKRKLYFLPLPCVGVVIEFPMRHNDQAELPPPDSDGGQRKGQPNEL